jgi:hypothetical protein
MKTAAYLMLMMIALTFFLTLGTAAAADDGDGQTLSGCEVFRSLTAGLCLAEEDDGGSLADACE